VIRIDDSERVRLITLDRPDALNAFNEALYDATTDALIDAADDPAVAVVVLTGTGRAFCAGTDVLELASRNAGTFVEGRHGFVGMIEQLRTFPKPFLLAINGLGVGIGATIVGFADLVFMSTTARLRCPFTTLALAPEAGSSFTFPRLAGRQDATWALLSSEWLPAEECLRMGLVWRLCPPDDLLADTMAHARVLASKPIASLVESKRTIAAAYRDEIASAILRENDAYSRLLGAPANIEALTALAEKREPDFAAIDRMAHQ
jgi:enoyl-CoA hydratase/carnithine racemase